MRKSLIKTASIITENGGKLSIEFLGNGVTKVTATNGIMPSKEILSGDSMAKIERAAEMLLAHFKPTIALPHSLPLSGDDERIINEAFPS